jgi:hypothetical protein
MLYLSSGDFSSLHGVTGLHAARILSDYTADRRAFSNAVWQALLALYLSLNRPELPSAEALAAATAVDLPDWNTILPTAVASDDDHVIKLVFACLAETRAGGGRIYHLLAAQKAGLAAPRAGEQPAIESQSEAPAVAAGR